MPQSYLEWFAERAPSRAEVDAFLDEAQPNWARFDPELGYALRDSIQLDGVDGAYTVGRYLASGSDPAPSRANREMMR